MRPTLAGLYASLNSHGAKYLVIGGVAATTYGVPRFTLDLDITIEATPENAEAVLSALRDAGLGTAFLIEADELLVQEIVVLQDAVRVDVQSRTPGIDFAVAWARRSVMEIEGVAVNFGCLDDIIASKEAAGRDVDREDVAILRRLYPERG